MNFEKIHFKHEFCLFKKCKLALYINVRDEKQTFSKFKDEKKLFKI
jgi:hypothetical protein